METKLFGGFSLEDRRESEHVFYPNRVQHLTVSFTEARARVVPRGSTGWDGFASTIKAASVLFYITIGISRTR